MERPASPRSRHGQVLDITPDSDECRRCAEERGYPSPPELPGPAPRGLEAVAEWVGRAGVPLVTFGQTVFWDEPAKAVLWHLMDRIGANLPLVLGVHDSDYFSKLHGWPAAGEGFRVLATNDWSRRGMWAAVAETWALFGAECVAPVAELVQAGVPLRRLAAQYGDKADAFLDAVTRAWGWRGVVHVGEKAYQTAREVAVAEVGEALVALFAWGLEATLQVVDDEEGRRAGRAWAEEQLAHLRAAVARHRGGTITDLYQELICAYYGWSLDGRSRTCQRTSTSEWLRFNRETAARARFQPVQCFLCPQLRSCCREAYNRAVHGWGMYELGVFGRGAIPFDLIVPGRGRGTIRVLPDAVRAELPKQPLVIPVAEAPCSTQALAGVIEDAVGSECALVGKAVMGPVMFCSEGLLVLHEGASAYVPATQRWVASASAHCTVMRTYPILRLHHRAFDALGAAEHRFHLPSHLAGAFGKPVVSAREFAERWREVVSDQEALLRRLGETGSVRHLLEVLEERGEPQAARTRQALEAARATLRTYGQQIEALRGRLADLRREERERRAERLALEAESGLLRHLEHTGAACEARQRVRARLAEAEHAIVAARLRREKLRAEIQTIHERPDFGRAQAEVDRLELRAERIRLRLARHAILTRRSLELANRRPAAWWFPMLDPSGRWFAEAAERADVYLESLARPPDEPSGKA